MKASKILLAMTALAFSGTAMAADMRMPVKAPPPVAVVYNWTGFYIGGNVGYSWGDGTNEGALAGTQNVSIFRTAGPDLISSVTTAVGPIPYNLGRTNVDGIIGGAQAGYNWQTGAWLFGIEADIQGSDEHGSNTICAAGCAPGAAFLSVENRLNWFGTLRGRVGWLPTDRVVLYATGGLAYGNLETTYTAGLVGVGNALAVTTSSTRAGWTVGGGVEGAIDRNWTVKLEYLYMDLGRFANGSSAATFTTNALNTPGQGFNTVTTTTIANTVSTRFTDHILRAGFNYRF
jgi:outer membrane immunogenic protein